MFNPYDFLLKKWHSFLSEDDNEIFGFYLTNVRGTYVEREHIDFSFDCITKEAFNGPIGVPVYWDREHGMAQYWYGEKSHHMESFRSGYFDLFGAYKYQGDEVPAEWETQARGFFKKYKALFAAAWEMVLHEYFLHAYLRNVIDFTKVLIELNLSKPKHKLLIKHFYAMLLDDKVYPELYQDDRKLAILKDVVRKYNIYNMND